VRPLFIAADNKSNGRYKLAYDIFGWLATQLGFSYVVAPFIFLSFSDSIKVWARLYFFVHIGLFAALGFFNSPGKKWLVDLQKKRVGRVEAEKEKTDRSAGVMGLPEDPMEDLEEIRLEFQQRRRESMVGRKKEL
jgi:lysophospholipid acyltransferase